MVGSDLQNIGPSWEEAGRAVSVDEYVGHLVWCPKASVSEPWVESSQEHEKLNSGIKTSLVGSKHIQSPFATKRTRRCYSVSNICMT